MERFGWVFIVAAGVLAASMLSGCSAEFSVRPIDSYKSEQQMESKPMWCRFVNCKTEEVTS